MEPSRRGPAHACRVGNSTPAAPSRLAATPSRSPPAGRSRSDISGSNALHARGEHVFPRFGLRAVRIDPAAGILDHEGAEARFAGVDRRPGDAEVGGEPDEKGLRETAIAQIAGEPRRRL